MKHLTVSPAYGRDYKNAKAVKADWFAGKDFIIQQIGHPYDQKPMGIGEVSGETIIIRYNRLTKTIII